MMVARRKQSGLGIVRVRALPGERAKGRLMAGPLTLPCALGRSGITRMKREGDGATPAGRFALIAGFWRADRLGRPQGGLAWRAIRPGDGWCDAPTDPAYNRPVTLPYPASAEEMRRDDHLYDVVIDIAWNRGPIIKGRGSAIFMHCARDGFAPTAGCVALRRADLVRLLRLLGPCTLMEIA
jgi:L,D-peptidoglycan transpeptidase YkuD (ErfK/YbiS/YcfS/YnhG family)